MEVVDSIIHSSLVFKTSIFGSFVMDYGVTDDAEFLPPLLSSREEA